MNRFYGPGLLLASLLAACGGGGGSGPLPTHPTPTVTATPTATPGQTYSAQLLFVGSLAGHTVQSDLRRAQVLAPMDAATPIPIMVVSPMSDQDNVGNIFGAQSFGGWVQAQVSPLPSASPSVAFANTDPDAQFTSFAPSPSPAPDVIAQTSIASNPSAVNAQASGTASAAIGDPVNLIPTVPVYTYRAISLECVAPYSPGSAEGWTWDGQQWNATPGAGDIYMTGPYCDNPYKTLESETTLHFPGGGVTLSTDTPFSAIAVTQWSNTQTSADLAALITLNGDGSNNGEILFQTQSGALVKLFPNGISRGGKPDYSGAIEVSGAGVDGF